MQSKYKQLYIIIVSVFLGVLTYIKAPNVTMDWVSFLFFIIGFAIDSFIPACIFVICRFFGVVYDISFQVWTNYAVISYVGVMCILKCKEASYAVFKKYLTLFLISILISFLLGEYSDLKVMLNIMIIFLILFTFALADYENKQNLLITSFFSAGFVIAIYTIVEYFSGQLELMATVKLNYGENVRNLANALAFPFFFSGYKVISSMHERQKFFMFWLVSFIIAGIVLVLSYSRGVILSSFISLALVYLLNVKSSNKFTLILISIVIYAFYRIIGSLDIDSETMYSDKSTIDRFEFWGFLFAKLAESPTSLLFGFGPCDMKVVTGNTIYDDYYTHSVFLDFLYLYGLTGFLILLGFLYKIIKKVISLKEPFFIGFLTLNLFMFTSHGSSLTIQFYAFLGLCLSSTIKKNKKNI